jgi:hypothetical protein
MTEAEWQSSSDPAAMIDWLSQQGYVAALWQFATDCCRRVWDDLPSDVFRRVVVHAETVGAHDIDDVLGDARQALEKLERRFHKVDDEEEQARLSRRIGYGRLVFAFDDQDSAGVAGSISNDLLEWAEDPETEQRTQADLLRTIVPDPSQSQWDDDGVDE